MPVMERKKRKLPVVLTVSEAESLLLAARNSVNDARTASKQLCAWRDFVMVQTGLLAGCRVAELCDLNVENVDLGGATLAIIEGKGLKDRNVPIGAKLLTVLREWIGERKTGPLFPGPNGKRLLPRTFQRRILTLVKAANIHKAVSPHKLRHTFACGLLRSGADVREVQELLGHANLQTTAVYLHVDTSRLKAAVDRL